MKKIIAIVLALTLALSLAACSGSAGDKTIKVGATPAPHAEILEVIKEALAADGWTLEIVQFERQGFGESRCCGRPMALDFLE